MSNFLLPARQLLSGSRSLCARALLASQVPAHGFVQRAYTTEAKQDAKDAAPQDAEAKLAATIAEKDKQIAQLQDVYRRSLADMENIRVRTKKEVESTAQYAIQKFAKDLLETSDVLGLALNSVPESERNSDSNPHLKDLFQGVSLTRSNLLKTFARHGLEETSPAGEKFDPNIHQAVFQAPIPGKEPGSIIEVVKTGFNLHGRVLRPAQFCTRVSGLKDLWVSLQYVSPLCDSKSKKSKTTIKDDDPGTDEDAAAIYKAKDEYFKEQLVRTQEIIVLRDKMRWCYRREGVNHLQNCRHLSTQYMDLLAEMRDGWIKPFVLPLPKEAPVEAAGGHH
ncbi:GrpE protein, mitochondrial [Dinochytrium kinnereticum]|nr:GrpE protein, mitochondrial [Dinochytrium kinnereticum]